MGRGEELSMNPNIFCCDYDYYKKRIDIHREELMKKVFHPRRLSGPIWTQRGPGMLALEISYKFIDG